MEKIISIYCSCKYKLNTSEYPDYKSEAYEGCVFTKLNVYDGEKILTFTPDKLKDIGFIFNKSVTLIAFDAYFNFSLLFHQLYKQGLNFDLDQCRATCCVTDLCNMVNYPLPKPSLKKSIIVFNECMKLAEENSILREISTFWITHGGERSQQGGKWLIFTKKCDLEIIWDTIIKNRELIGYDMSRVSTMAVNIWGGKRDTGVIEIFISKDSGKIRETGNMIAKVCEPFLKNLGVNRLIYKTNQQTALGTRLSGSKHNSTMYVNIL